MNEGNDQNQTQQRNVTESGFKKHFCRVTYFSKSLALLLFIALPVIGFWMSFEYGGKYESQTQVVFLNAPDNRESEGDLEEIVKGDGDILQTKVQNYNTQVDIDKNKIIKENYSENTAGFILLCKPKGCGLYEQLEGLDRFFVVEEKTKTFDDWLTYVSPAKNFSFQYPAYMNVDGEKVVASTTREGIFGFSSRLFTMNDYEGNVSEIGGGAYYNAHGESSGEALATTTFQGYPAFIHKSCDMGGCALSLVVFTGEEALNLIYEDQWSDNVFSHNDVEGDWSDFNKDTRLDILSTFKILR